MRQRQRYKSLLIVEDDEDALVHLERFFTLIGYQVATATDGLAALKILRDKRNSFQLILTDLVMPNISGMALITAVKKEFSDIKVIAITGHGEPIADLALAAEAEAVFLKPLDLKGLEAFIDGIIE